MKDNEIRELLAFLLFHQRVIKEALRLSEIDEEPFSEAYEKELRSELSNAAALEQYAQIMGVRLLEVEKIFRKWLKPPI